MAKYRFRLETLRKLRASHRDALRGALADAYRAEEVLGERRAAIADEQAHVREIQRRALGGGHLDVNRLIEAQRYEMILKAHEQLLAEQSATLAVETDRRRTALVEADRAVRVLDLLDEKKKNQHRRAELRMETKELDEIASIKRPTV